MEKQEKPSFRTRHEIEIRTLAKQIRSELLGDVIPFWEERVEDSEHGGYLTCFDRTGNCMGRRKSGWFVGRSMYTFAMLYNKIEKKDRWFDLAQRGRDYVKPPFYAGNGRFNCLMDAKGRILEGTTSIFTDHFVVKGMYAYLLARQNHSGDEIWQEKTEEDIVFAQSLSDRLFANVRMPEILSGENVFDGMEKHAIWFMTLIVALESRGLFGSRYEDILQECVSRSLYFFTSDDDEAAFEYVGNDGRVIPEGPGRLMDSGHTMESLWFAMRAGRELGHAEYLTRAETILNWVIKRCYDEEYGGFYQHVDVWNHRPEEAFRTTDYGSVNAEWDDKLWWVQAEGLYALALSALWNENEHHYRYFLKLYQYIQNHFRDHEYGEWYSMLKRDGSMLFDQKGFNMKGPYHIPRCLIQLYLLLKEF